MCFIKFISFSTINAQFAFRVLRNFLSEPVARLPVVSVQRVVAVEEDEPGVGWRVGGHFCRVVLGEQLRCTAVLGDGEQRRFWNSTGGQLAHS